MKSGINIFVDSNIFIYWLNGSATAAEILSQNNIHYSIITEIEVKAHGSLLQAADAAKLQQLLNRFQKIGLTEDIKDLAILFRTRYKLKTPDAIICASARRSRIPLVTADKKVLSVKEIVTVLFDPS